ncbi:MAG: transcriptional repressor LexA [Clostridia bacterium]|nr:transcriptional repressor LexA [Clostridia bacterium]
MNNLTEREQMVLDFMKEHVAKWGYPPTVRDIAAAVGIKSTSTVQKAIDGLVVKGYVKRQDGKRRALDIVDTNPAKPAPVKEVEREDVIDLPVVGRIAAGTPILAEQNIDDTFPIPSRFVGKGTNFMLTVHGQSMIEAGIFNGDYILVQQQETANNGDIVVAMIDGMESEATVKEFHKENGHIRLQPKNSEMDPIIVDDCKILGIVKGVFRYLN